MDKYTVDLDKVLNDFEYSELTDQYSIGTSSQPLNNSSAQRQSDLYKPPIKHTINNVFQSLNEYLNTDIGGKSKTSEFNNVKDTNIVAEGNVSTKYGPERLENDYEVNVRPEVLIGREIKHFIVNAYLLIRLASSKDEFRVYGENHKWNKHRRLFWL